MTVFWGICLHVVNMCLNELEQCSVMYCAHCVTLSFDDTKVSKFSLKPKSETLVSHFILRLWSRTKGLVSAKDKLTRCVCMFVDLRWLERASIRYFTFEDNI